MEIQKISRWEDARPYLEMLAQTVVDDIVPLLSTPGQAPHTLAREVFSYVDHLGHLFTGSSQVGQRFGCYLREVMGLLDVNYARWTDAIYEMYRNGPVHEFDPKVLENDHGQRLAWLSYPGQRDEPRVSVGDKIVSLSHLVPLQIEEGNVYHLPTSRHCLVLDLLWSIRKFIEGVGAESMRVTAWNAAAQELSAPKRHDFSLQ